MQRIAAKVQTSAFSIRYWFSSVKFGIIEYYDPWLLQRACSQDADLSCHVLISIILLHCVIMIHQRYRQMDEWTDRRTDGSHARGIGD